MAAIPPGVPGNPYPPGSVSWHAWNYAAQKAGGKPFGLGAGGGGSAVAVYQVPAIHQSAQIPTAPPTQTPPFDPSLKPDVIVQARAYSTPTAPGTVPLDAFVGTSFDARPINGQDLLAWAVAPGGIAPALPFTASFTAPPGWRAILRAYSYEVSVTNAGNAIYDVYGEPVYFSDGGFHGVVTTISVNNSPVQGFSNVLGGNYEYDRPCYVLIDEGQTVTVALTMSDFVSGAPQSGLIQLYGNLLLNTGRQLVAEPAPASPEPVFLKAPPTP